MIIHSLIHSFHAYSLSICGVPGTVLGAKDTAVNKTGKTNPLSQTCRPARGVEQATGRPVSNMHRLVFDTRC